MRFPRVLALGLALFTVAGGTAFAQSYPAKPITIVVPYAPGGGVDTVARALGQELGKALATSVIVENKPGASSIVGSEYVAKAPADGYVLLANVGTHYAMPYLANNVRYDPVKDFTPITIVGRAPQVLIVHPSVPAKTVPEFLAYVRANPGKVSYATAGKGTSQHLGGEMLNSMARLDMVHVPYKGGGPALNDVLGGQVPAAISIMSNVLPHAKAGKVQMLGVIESKRSKAAPEVPTVGDTVSGFAVPDTWIGILGPRGLPAEVVAKLNDALVKVTSEVAVRTRLEAAGFEVDVTQAPEFAKLAPQASEAYRRITQDAKIAPE
jgi:tripartite-type tricarboxylate transporter receptor subunit TctC